MEEEVKTEYVGDKAYIRLNSTEAAKNINLLRNTFEKVLDNEIKEVILDMSKILQVDSSTVGVLVMYFKRMKEKKIIFKLMFVREEVKRILKLVNLYSYFEIIE